MSTFSLIGVPESLPYCSILVCNEAVGLPPYGGGGYTGYYTGHDSLSGMSHGANRLPWQGNVSSNENVRSNIGSRLRLHLRPEIYGNL
jgi:hypothetical protein